MPKLFSALLTVALAVCGFPAGADAASTSSKLISVSNTGACIVPGKKLLTVEVTSERVEVPHASGIQAWFADPTIGVIAEFDVTLSSPTDGADQRVFPAAKTVSLDGSRALDVVRVVNQFSPIRRMSLEIAGSDGTTSPFASVDVQIFLVRKTGDSTVTRLANAVETIGGSVPNQPWAAGTQLYGNLVKQVLSSFASSEDAQSRLPSSNLSLQLAATNDDCTGFLQDGVNMVVEEAVPGLHPRPGEEFVSLSDLDSKCLYATSGPDPDIKFANKTGTTCSTTIPAEAKTLGNPGLIFRAIGFDIPTVVTPPATHLPAPTAAVGGASRSLVNAFVARNRLGLTNNEINIALQGGASASKALPDKTDTTAWALRALAKCKQFSISVDHCL